MILDRRTWMKAVAGVAAFGSILKTGKAKELKPILLWSYPIKQRKKDKVVGWIVLESGVRIPFKRIEVENFNDRGRKDSLITVHGKGVPDFMDDLVGEFVRVAKPGYRHDRFRSGRYICTRLDWMCIGPKSGNVKWSAELISEIL